MKSMDEYSLTYHAGTPQNFLIFHNHSRDVQELSHILDQWPKLKNSPPPLCQIGSKLKWVGGSVKDKRGWQNTLLDCCNKRLSSGCLWVSTWWPLNTFPPPFGTCDHCNIYYRDFWLTGRVLRVAKSFMNIIHCLAKTDLKRHLC